VFFKQTGALDSNQLIKFDQVAGLDYNIMQNIINKLSIIDHNSLALTCIAHGLLKLSHLYYNKIIYKMRKFKTVLINNYKLE